MFIVTYLLYVEKKYIIRLFATHLTLLSTFFYYTETNIFGQNLGKYSLKDKFIFGFEANIKIIWIRVQINGINLAIQIKPKFL